MQVAHAGAVALDTFFSLGQDETRPPRLCFYRPAVCLAAAADWMLTTEGNQDQSCCPGSRDQLYHSWHWDWEACARNSLVELHDVLQDEVRMNTAAAAPVTQVGPEQLWTGCLAHCKLVPQGAPGSLHFPDAKASQTCCWLGASILSCLMYMSLPCSGGIRRSGLVIVQQVSWAPTVSAVQCT